MISFKNENILFVFSDPGGAKPILSIAIKSLVDNKVNVFSDRIYDFYNEYNIVVQKANSNNIKKICTILEPSLIITGTSYTTDFEIKALQWAKENGITCYSFVDNWSNFKVRFTIGSNFILPNIIFVIDHLAKQNAVADGIPSDVIFVLGYNPHWKYLESWKPIFCKDFLFDHYSISKEKKILYFVPDPLTNVGGKEKYGFDEYTATEYLLEKYKDYHFLFKMHPNQNIQIMHFFKEKNIKFIQDNTLHNHLLFYSDEIISFFSNALVEAKILGGNPKRYLLGLKIDDPFMDKEIEILSFTE